MKHSKAFSTNFSFRSFAGVRSKLRSFLRRTVSAGIHGCQLIRDPFAPPNSPTGWWGGRGRDREAPKTVSSQRLLGQYPSFPKGTHAQHRRRRQSFSLRGSRRVPSQLGFSPQLFLLLQPSEVASPYLRDDSRRPINVPSGPGPQACSQKGGFTPRPSPIWPVGSTSWATEVPGQERYYLRQLPSFPLPPHSSPDAEND